MPQQGSFDDAEELTAPPGIGNGPELIATLHSLMRADVSGIRFGAIKSTIQGTAAHQRMQMLLSLADALRDERLQQWIDADAKRHVRAVAIVREVCPSDPPASEHGGSEREGGRVFSGWFASGSALGV